jgi:hypothetical protein
LADRAIGNLQQWLVDTYHGVSRVQLQVYLDEFVFRHNLQSMVLSMADKVDPFLAAYPAVGLGYSRLPYYHFLDPFWLTPYTVLRRGVGTLYIGVPTKLSCRSRWRTPAIIAMGLQRLSKGCVVMPSAARRLGARAQFDPTVAALLPSVLDQFEMIRRRYLDTINAPAQT